MTSKKRYVKESQSLIIRSYRKRITLTIMKDNHSQNLWFCRSQGVPLKGQVAIYQNGRCRPFWSRLPILHSHKFSYFSLKMFVMTNFFSSCRCPFFLICFTIKVAPKLFENLEFNMTISGTFGVYFFLTGYICFLLYVIFTANKDLKN